MSDIDREVEAFIRGELRAQYPQHGVIGEESGADAASRARIVWAVDPIDGTTNFINGLPLIASSIGVLCEGVPIAGAIWCGATHALRPGIAFTAAGHTEVAHLSRPSLWDAAAGLALLRASGCAALAQEEGLWRPLEIFTGDLAHWSRPMLAGDEHALKEAVRILCL